MLKGKKIILGITGSIAAYKAAFLLRLLVKEEAEVQVLITNAGKEFITPATLSALSGRPVLGTFFETGDGTWHSHVDLGTWADAMIIAPASANTLAKMTAGVCDNLLLTTYLSARCPVFIAPAMDLDMFSHPATQSNITLLEKHGCMIIEPATGVLASGLHGKGRMEEPEAIVEKIRKYYLDLETRPRLDGKRVLVTAGPTYEKIDPVRYIGNYSSGKMGFAIAERLAARGAIVDLIAGPVQLSVKNENINRINIVSARAMFEKSTELFPLCDGAIMTAAVADYAPAKISPKKIKRKSENITLKLKANPDIAAKMGEIKRDNQVLCGFALETDNEEENAIVKLKKKKFDFIVLNSLVEKGAGFMSDTNRITIIDTDNKKQVFPLKSKKDVADDVIDFFAASMLKKEHPQT
ncbi:MAG: bifunctional phosphopantothenoylcysteine decarboxylase/phosphopantothenate--cysteine ligase CoaBC [Cytophagaceae bacterium]|jgi:phosphopantothenoylcysteine decarboxylase/phosphopantothenate--cysteine ligase|nr:bifunctional phosphopantothenoylcysteine decarboxylase/phosphopantothenate--cysteine ligase CoaBC [Cytophagaceae bacterium]